ncbi:MAG: hypothetical protein ABIX01_18380 [Chitinophagaceae bacterium]
MDFKNYLDAFEKAAKGLDKKLANKKGLEIQTGIWLDAVVLRLQKKHWANKPDEKPHSGPAIFMGIWLDEKSIAANILLYNIHALRLRQLKGYRLQSRIFAASFREKFKDFEPIWPNASVQFGPQTLMQGWSDLNFQTLQKDVLELANKFCEIEFLIEETLGEFK